MIYIIYMQPCIYSGLCVQLDVFLRFTFNYSCSWLIVLFKWFGTLIFISFSFSEFQTNVSVNLARCLTWMLSIQSGGGRQFLISQSISRNFPLQAFSLSLFTFIFLMLINLYFSGWNFTFSSSLLSPFQAFSLSYLWQAVPDQPIYLRLEFSFSSLFITFVFFSSFTFEDSSQSDPLKFPTKN